MATARLIAKSLSTSEKRAKLHDVTPLAEFCQAMYPLLVAHSDDYGRLDGSVFHVKHAVEPTSPRNVIEFEAALFALMAVELIDWYFDSKGKAIIQVIDFKEHQPGLKQRGGSKIEAFSEMARRMAPGIATDRREVPRDAVGCREMPSDLNLLDLKRNETNKSSGAGAPHPPVRVITKLAHEAIDRLGVKAAYVDLREEVKCLCAKHGIDYDSEATGKALESALVQRRRSA